MVKISSLAYVRFANLLTLVLHFGQTPCSKSTFFFAVLPVTVADRLALQ